jgi:hydrogenase 3 maturation protease
MTQTLEHRLAEYRRLSTPDTGDFRVAVLGIGNDLNADDAAGVLAARAVMDCAGKHAADARAPEGAALAGGVDMARGALPGLAWLVIDAGPSPESFTGPLRRFAPNLVVMIDAAQMGAPPGEVRVFEWPEV